MTAAWRARHRPLLAPAVVPVAAYLVVLLVIALLVSPPLLGWIGLAVVAVVGVAIAASATYLWPRSRVNVDRLHPHPSESLRLLVVVDAEVEPHDLARAVARRAGGRQVEVRIAAPATDGAAATRRLTLALRALGGPRVHAEGRVGAHDPLEAAGDELLTFPADEILFVGPAPASRHLLERDFERQARDLFGVHCSTLASR